MSATRIEWADRRWNPITGCTKVSAGCAHCYAERMARRLAGRYGYPEGSGFAVTFHENRLPLPATWKKPCRVFVNSMSDLFHPDVRDAWRDRILDVIRKHPRHTFMVLTKRIQAAAEYLDSRLIPDNLWLGVTTENQVRADERIPVLLSIPAAVRFVSAEPMLEPVTLWPWLGAVAETFGTLRGPPGALAWVICGAETGPGARPMRLEWARDLRDKCAASSTPFFFKKAGPGIETPPDLMIRQFPGEIRS